MSIQQSVQESFEATWEGIKNLDTIYAYNGTLVYLRGFHITNFKSPKPGRKENVSLQFFYLNTKLKRTEKEACTIWYSTFLVYISTGKMEPYEEGSTASAVPGRMKGYKALLYRSGQDEYNRDMYTAIFVTRKKCYKITQGRKGYYSVLKGDDITKIDGEMYLNTSSYGYSITYRKSSGKYGMSWAYASGKMIEEISIEDAQALFVEQAL